MSQRPYDFPGDPELAHLIASKAADHCTWITPIEDDHLPIFYATTNVWEFLGQGLPDKRWISIGVCQTADMEDNLRLGRALGDAIAESDRKVMLDRVGSHVAHLLAVAQAARPRSGWRRAHLLTPRPPRRTPSGWSGSRRATMQGSGHDARVLSVPAGGSLRSLPDDDRGTGRGRLRRREQAVRRV
jgi:hypothetical protein